MIRMRYVLPVALSLSLLSTGCTMRKGAPATGVAASPRAASPDEIPFRRTDPGGIGSLTAKTDRGETGLVRLERVTVRAVQAGDVAQVEVEHVFQSDADVALEGTFRFPLPDGAILTGLAMWIDGKLVEGELVERDKARKVFEEIVDRMQDPALLEWEHGTTFKMRVFPIEPKQKKLVTIRYLAPLERKGDGYVFAHSGRSPAGQAPKRFEVFWEGKRIADEADVSSDRVVEVRAAPPPNALAESAKDGTYTLARFVPDWSKIPERGGPGTKNFVFVVDTSRSALEERKLALESLRTMLGALPAGARFVVLTSDVDVRVDPAGFATGRDAIEGAVRFVEARDDDGASDLDAALARAGALARESGNAAVVYVGDAEPTWGETRGPELVRRAAEHLAGAPLHVLLLGAEVDVELAKGLAATTGGRVLHARDPRDVRAFADALPRPTRAITDLRIQTEPPATVLAGDDRFLAFGDELTIGMRTGPGDPAPRSLVVEGMAHGKPVRFSMALAAIPAPHVQQRYGALLVGRLERDEGQKDEIVKASLEHRVMSKYTSFLVLESEEAYARYAIERRAKQELDGPRVTGADLESADGDGADVSMTRVQPGDPEILVDAPEDTRSVRVVFPFGETKVAEYDPEARGGHGAWMVRFLVPRETPEGVYEAVAEIVHRDGRTEARRVTYTVDRTPPPLQVTIRRIPGRPELRGIHVTQRGPKEFVDLRRVELSTPGGEILELTARTWGDFIGTFPVDPAGQGGHVRVVGVDQALNHTAVDVELP